MQWKNYLEMSEANAAGASPCISGGVPMKNDGWLHILADCAHPSLWAILRCSPGSHMRTGSLAIRTICFYLKMNIKGEFISPSAAAYFNISSRENVTIIHSSFVDGTWERKRRIKVIIYSNIKRSEIFK